MGARTLKFWLLLWSVLAATSTAQAQTVLFRDTFNTSSASGNIDFEVSTRQTGTYAGTTYIGFTPGAYTVGYGTGQIRFTPANAANLATITPNRNFNDAVPSGGYMYVKLDFNPAVDDANISWVALSVGDPGTIYNWSGWAARTGFAIFFRNSGGYAAYDGQTQIGGGTYTGTPSGMHTVELRISDGSGSPFDGTGGSTIDVHIDGNATPLMTFTKPSPGYTNNRVHIWAERDGGPDPLYHDFDNFEVGMGSFASTLTASPSPKAMPPTVVNTSSGARPITITNAGGSSRTISSIAFTSGDTSQFSVAPGTCPSLTPTLAAGSSCTVLLTFSPTSLTPSTAKTATLHIVASDGTLDVTVTGTTGTAAQIPTVSEWGLILLCFMLGGTMLHAMRKRDFRA